MLTSSLLNRPASRGHAALIRFGTRLAAGLAACLLALPGSSQAWEAETRIVHYQVKGSTGAELYQSIGQKGPKLGLGRVIALTGFKLTWTRDYQRQGEACVLATAVPKLVITHTLPKPATRLKGEVADSWARFAAGVEAHERIHGDFIRDLVNQIEATSVGLRVDSDPDCKKIRVELTTRLAALSKAQRDKSRAFDQVELGDGGNVHQLVLALVNGP